MNYLIHITHWKPAVDTIDFGHWQKTVKYDKTFRHHAINGNWSSDEKAINMARLFWLEYEEKDCKSEVLVMKYKEIVMRYKNF